MKLKPLSKKQLKEVEEKFKVEKNLMAKISMWIILEKHSELGLSTEALYCFIKHLMKNRDKYIY